MISKLKKLYESTDGNQDEQQIYRKGIQTLMGTALLNTRAHVVSGPMASCLVLHGSRFGYADDFVYVNIKHFMSGCLDDIILTSNYKGSTFLKSMVANYLCRPRELIDTCLYNFLSCYTTTKGRKKEKKVL